MGALRVFSGRKAWIIPATVLVFGVGLAAAGCSEERKPVDRLPELMGLLRFDTTLDQLAQIAPAGLKQGMRQPPAGALNPQYITEKLIAAVDSAARATFAPDKLRRDFLRSLDGRLTNADLDAIFTFYQSPPGKQITDLETTRLLDAPKKAGELSDMFRRMSDTMQREPERAAVLKQIVDSLRGTEFAIGPVLAIHRALAIGMVAADEKTAALSAEAIQAIDASVEKTGTAMEVQAKEMAVLSLAYGYRDAGMQELQGYLAFLKSPAGQKLRGACTSALNQVMVKAGTEFGHALMRELGKEWT
jgi:hypothetical protein